MTDPIRTPFDAQTTAAQAIAGIDLTGRRAIVTGGASGIGVETARALAGAGAAVTLAVRDVAAGERVAAEIGGRVAVGALDLADRGSVAAFAAAWDGPLHLLINNAGVMAPPLTRTAEGWELQLATNHLGHFALAVALHGALARGAQESGAAARVVSLSSRGHLRAPVDFDDLDFVERPYDPWIGYGQSKTANVLFAVEAQRRWAGDGIVTNAVHPGAIMDTKLSRHMDPAELERLRASGLYTYKSVEQGAATTIVAATSPLFAAAGGRYLEDGEEAVLLAPDAVEGAPSGVAPYALDPDAAERLWAVSVTRS